MAMSFGIHIGHMGGPLEEMRRLWKFADSAGFDWFSVSDHFQESPPRGGEIDCFEAITTLTAAAVETTRVRLGALVYCVAYRNPGLHAKSLTKIDHLSHGRVYWGPGAGRREAEVRRWLERAVHRARGVDPQGPGPRPVVRDGEARSPVHSPHREPRLLPRCRRQGRRARRAGLPVALRQGPARRLPARHTEG